MTPYEIQVVDIAPIPTVVVRRCATFAQLPQVVPAACGTVWEFLRAKKVRAGRNVALDLSDKVDLEAGAEALGPLTPEGEVIISQLPGGRVATTKHIGPYAALGAAHQAVRGWCERHHHALTIQNWEIYGHWQAEWNADPSKIETDVYYLLR